MNPQEWQILMVEDEYDSIQMVSKILRHHGVQVQIAHDGHECIKLLQTFIPTLIIMDLALPEMDGWETLTQVRAHATTASIPVVAITAYHSVNVEEDAQAAGFDAYLPKPLDTSTLMNQLGAIIERGH